MRRFAAIALCILASAIPVSPAFSGETITYTYDSLGRLIEAANSGTVNTGATVTTTFDPAGNRQTYTVTGSTPQLAIGNASVTEGGDLSFTVTRSGNTSVAASAQYDTSGGTATSGSDFTAVTGGMVSFASGEISKLVTINTTDDGLAESSETMSVVLSNPSTGATIGEATGTGTIIDNDTPANISVSNASVTEGGNLSFTVSLSQAAGSTVSVDYETSDGTASAGSDYTPAIGTLTFTPGQVSKAVTIATADDDYVEDGETLTLTLSSPTGGAVIGDDSGTGTINDNDDADVTFSISDASVSEGGNLTFTISKSGFGFSSFTVNYTTADGSAVAGSDYTASTGSVSFSPFQNSKTVTISTIEDSVEEAAETMSVLLTSSSGNSALADYTGTGTITDDDAPPPAQIAISNASVTEGGTLSFTVTRSGNTSIAASVDYATSNGSATAGSDYTAGAGSLNFSAGQTSQAITVSTADDGATESSETMTVTLSSPSSGATIINASGTGTINDNDAPAQLTIGNASVTEGGTLSFSVTRSGNTSIAASVDYTSSNGSATAGSDYTAASGSLNFAAGETSKVITVSTADDSTTESSETMIVTLSNPSSGATISGASGTGMINDNDVPVAFSIANASATEGGNLIFAVTKSGTASGTVSVHYATSNGTATAGSDYTTKSGNLSFTVSQTTQNVTVSTTDDSTVESAENLTVTLSSPTGGAIVDDGTATGTINDNDVNPANIAIGDASATEGGTLSFTVTRSGNTTSSVSAHYATASGTATSGSDFTAKSGTVSFSSGQTSKAVTVSTTDDSATESTETMTVGLSSPSSGASITDASGTGTINDNDDTLIALTTNGLTVLPAHQSVYSCYSTAYPELGLYYDECRLISNNEIVYYDSTGGFSPQLDTGYSMPGYNFLYVLSSHYGTSD